MNFYTEFNKNRPIRLSEKTRKFAFESLNCKYGKETMQNLAVTLDSSLKGKNALEIYDIAVTKIASEAPIRICENELISGSATLGGAILHRVPYIFDGDNIDDGIGVHSVSHLTVDFFEILEIGYEGIEQKVLKFAKENTDKEKAAFYKSATNAVNAFKIYHKRYIEALKDKEGYEENYKVLLNVPKHPARNFREAVSSLWFTFSFLRLCGNWPGIGRIDVLLGKYLKADIENGTITLDEAREILAHLFIKGCEWIRGDEVEGGDAQHYQNIIIGGIDIDKNEVTNEVSYLVLDIVEELGISDFPISVRLNKNTPERLLRRIAEVVRFGGGVVAVYSEDTVIKSMCDYGYKYEEAVNFTNDGCWETQVPGKSFFNYEPFDALDILHDCIYKPDNNFGSFEALYSAFKEGLHKFTCDLERSIIKCNFEKDGSWKPRNNCTVISLFEHGCLEKGRQYNMGGPVYNVISPHLGGLSDVANSLYAIKKLCFDEKKVTFAELCDIIENNWDNNEELRQYALTHFKYYGNDNDEVDFIAKRIIDDFSVYCKQLDKTTELSFPCGISTFGRQIEWLQTRCATAFGKKKGEILSGNTSPTPGTDCSGATSVIKSFCKIDLSKATTGAALDVEIMPGSVEGENGIEALISLFKGFVALNGYFMQIDVTSAEALRQAQQNPDKFRTLSVRVSGWNARFATLGKAWQDMVIERTEKG